MPDIEILIVLEDIHAEERAAHDARQHIGEEAQPVAFVLADWQQRTRPSPRSDRS